MSNTKGFIAAKLQWRWPSGWLGFTLINAVFQTLPQCWPGCAVAGRPLCCGGVFVSAQLQTQQPGVLHQHSRSTWCCHCAAGFRVFHVRLIFCRRCSLGFSSQVGFFSCLFGKQKGSVILNYRFWPWKYIFMKAENVSALDIREILMVC